MSESERVKNKNHQLQFKQMTPESPEMLHFAMLRIFCRPGFRGGPPYGQRASGKVGATTHQYLCQQETLGVSLVLHDDLKEGSWRWYSSWRLEFLWRFVFVFLFGCVPC